MVTMVLITINLLLYNGLASIYDRNWVTGDPPMPITIHYPAAAHYNDTILIFGANNSYFEYNILNDNMIAHTSFVPQFRGYGQFYAQTNDIFYWIDWSSLGEYIFVYNLKTRTLEPNISLFETHDGYIGQNPSQSMTCGCLAAHADALYLLAPYGCVDGPNELYIYNLSTQMWIFGPPTISDAAEGQSCIIEPTTHELYFFRRTIEKILIDDITNQNWEIVGTWKNAKDSRMVSHKGNILIIGGHEWVNGNNILHRQVYMIDAKNGTSGIIGNLSYGVATAGIILADDIVYAFGGSSTSQGDFLNTWQFLDLRIHSTVYPTTHPTLEPTSNPTLIPTLHPTSIPTTVPTSNPTLLPTSNPTLLPTSNPTLEPTSNPTLLSRLKSTLEPTVNPTSNPTLLPTLHPTSIPTTDTTLNPTHAPSRNATIIAAVSSDSLLIIAIIICILLCLILIVAVLIYFKLHKNRQKHDNQDDRVIVSINIDDHHSEIEELSKSPKLPKFPKLPKMNTFTLTPPGLAEQDTLTLNIEGNMKAIEESEEWDINDMDDVKCMELEEKQSALSDDMYENPEELKCNTPHTLETYGDIGEV